MASERRPCVVVVGGGLAGLSAAFSLARHGCQVTLCEARARLGGRASSFVDPQSGEMIDNCQHVSMGCCTNLKHFCFETGIAAQFRRDRELTFIGPQGDFNTFRASAWPAPLHLAGAFLKLRYLTMRDKRLLGMAILKLARTHPRNLQGICFGEWLQHHGQTRALMDYVWEVILVSALSESLDRIDAAYARKVLVDGFLTHRSGWEVHVPLLPWDELYKRSVQPALQNLGMNIRLSSPAAQLDFQENRVTNVRLQNHDVLPCDAAILAVPPPRALDLLPASSLSAPLLESIKKLEFAPISSLHLWFNQPITQLPHAVIVGRLSQWLFAKEFPGQSPPPFRFGYQVVISASRQLKEMSQTDVVQRILNELAEIFPKARAAKLLHQRLLTEQRAVFSALPGVDQWRPGQQSPWANLQLAGDWTQTGWPATMESAVRSGYMAAENTLCELGRPVQLLQPDLPISTLARWLGIR